MEANKNQVEIVVNNSDVFVPVSGNTYKSQRELITDHWCRKKKEARLRGEDFDETDKAVYIIAAKILYPFEGRYVIDSEGNVKPLINI